MAGPNTTARLITALVGSDSQNWSLTTAVIDDGRDSIGNSGILAARGTITLFEDVSNPESIRPLDNPQRWHKGQTLSLQVADDSGTQVAHPLGVLFVTSIPTFDYRSFVLTLEVGDALAFYDNPESSGDASGFTLCDATSVNLATIATRYLEAAGIPSANISLGTWDVATSTPIQKGSGSYVARAGEIANACGQRLYVDKVGIVRSKALDLSPGTADLTITIGQDEVEFTAEPELLEPFETVQVAGVGKGTQTQQNPIITSFGDENVEVYNFQEYDLSPTQFLGPQGSIVPIEDGNYIRLWTRKQLRQREDQIVNGSTSSTKITAYDRNEFRYYRETAACKFRLHYIFRYNDAAEVTYLAEGSTIPARIEESTENFTYSDDDELLRHVIDDYAREDVYDPDNGIAIQRRLVRRAIQQWTKRGENLWEFEDTEQQPAIRVRTDNEFEDESAKWRLVPSKEPVFEPAVEPGKNSPPKSEYWTPYNETTTVYEGTAAWTQRGAATGLDRKRPPVQLPEGLPLTQQMVDNLAAIERDLLDGRTRQFRIAIACSDTLLDIDEPFPRIDVVEGDRVRQYLFDAVAWVHDAESLTVQGLGIEIRDSLFPTSNL